MDTATFGITDRNLPQTQQAFVQKLAPAIARVCAGRLAQHEAEQCLRDAADYSGWGRFAFANNYWLLPGRGDAGSFLIVRVQRDYSSPGGYAPEVLRYAKFSSLDTALDAWCKARNR